MSIEAMKQALEKATEVMEAACIRVDELKAENESLRQAIAEAEKQDGWVLREVLFSNGEPIAHREAEKQEPVAVKRMKEWIVALKRRSDNGEHMKIDSGLSAGTCWELAIELEQFINTHPQPKQEPLTDEQIEACLHHVDEDGIGLFAFARAIEAAHGIKENT